MPTSRIADVRRSAHSRVKYRNNRDTHKNNRSIVESLIVHWRGEWKSVPRQLSTQSLLCGPIPQLKAQTYTKKHIATALTILPLRSSQPSLQRASEEKTCTVVLLAGSCWPNAVRAGPGARSGNTTSSLSPRDTSRTATRRTGIRWVRSQRRCRS